MNFVEAMKLASSRLFDFSGRSRRSEFWWWIVPVLLVNNIVSMFITNLWVSAVVSTVIMFFGLAATARRLQDTNNSALWVYVSYALGIIIQVFFASSETMTKLISMTQSGASEKALTKFVEKNVNELSCIGGISVAFCIVSLIVIIFCLLDSKAHANKYGDSPKYYEA